MNYRVIIRGAEAGASVICSGTSSIDVLIKVLQQSPMAMGELGRRSLESLVITVDPEPAEAGTARHRGRRAA